MRIASKNIGSQYPNSAALAPWAIRRTLGAALIEQAHPAFARGDAVVEREARFEREQFAYHLGLVMLDATARQAVHARQ